jgi:hypothetical protein
LALSFVGLGDLTVFQKRPAVRLEEHAPPATRQVTVGNPALPPPDLPVTIWQAGMRR